MRRRHATAGQQCYVPLKRHLVSNKNASSSIHLVIRCVSNVSGKTDSVISVVPGAPGYRRVHGRELVSDSFRTLTTLNRSLS